MSQHMRKGRPIGKHGAQFASVPKVNNCVYLAELSSGVVKVGFSNAPQMRLISLSRHWSKRGVAICRHWVCAGGPAANWKLDPHGNERAAIEALTKIAPPLTGRREYFDIPYEQALAVIANVLQGV